MIKLNFGGYNFQTHAKFSFIWKDSASRPLETALSPRSYDSTVSSGRLARDDIKKK